MAHQKRTGKSAATRASKTLRSRTVSRASKSAAGSALAQRKTTKLTGKSAATQASKTLRSKTASKASKSAAGSALSQRHSRKR